MKDITERKQAEKRDTEAMEAAEAAHEGEVEFPCEHEPRDSHADERHHRHVALDICERSWIRGNATT